MKKIFFLMLSFLMLSVLKLSAEDVSTYLVGDYVDVDTAKSKLGTAGFEVLAEYESVKGGDTIVFTNSALKAQGVKPKRAHAAVLRMFVDNQEKKISVTNPVYFGKAFMQDEYDAKVFNAQLKAINAAFPGLVGSVDKLDFDDLAEYHYRPLMPYYQDVDELAKGEQSALIEKARSYKKGKSLIFELKLSETTTLFGYDLGSKTKKFVEKIGRANGAILPYCILVENGTATALQGKYYLAINYPLLSMGTFMTIAPVPGAITKDLEKPFK